MIIAKLKDSVAKQFAGYGTSSGHSVCLASLRRTLNISQNYKKLTFVSNGKGIFVFVIPCRHPHICALVINFRIG